MRRTTFILPVLPLLLGGLACSGDEECAASFNDVVENAGAVCDDQAARDACYEKPQVCPSRSPVRFCRTEVGNPTSVTVVVNNLGQADLNVTSVSVKGDERCAFGAPQYSPAIGDPIPGRDGLIIRLKYDPPSEGDDRIALEIVTDAENYPLLYVPVCGLAVDPGTEGQCVGLGCVDDDDCPANWTCDAGSARCVKPGVDEVACVKNADCPSDQVCGTQMCISCQDERQTEYTTCWE